MSEEGGSGKGLAIGCVIGAVVVGVVAVLGLIFAAGALFFWSSAAPSVPAPGIVTTGVVKQQPPNSDQTPPGNAPAPDSEVLALELTGTGDRGTWYTLDGTIYEGDQALKTAVAEMAAEAAKAGRRLTISMTVVSNAGVTAQAEATARKICTDAGAEVTPPARGGEKVGK